MRKLFVSAIALTSIALSTSAQSAVDAYTLSGNRLFGTARFMAMGGAFTALGGDISTLNQNPAGLGIYRRSEIALTLDINPTSTSVKTPIESFSDSKTNFNCTNFGYVGTAQLDNDIFKTFSWGVSYARTQDFSRTYHVGGRNGYPSIQTSLSNYISSYSGTVVPDELLWGNNYDPYRQTDYDWLTILAYNAMIVNPTGPDHNRPSDLQGLWTNGTSGNVGFDVRQRGSVDEYAIDFGGNIAETVMWGIGFGITDLQFTEETNYSEELSGANISNAQENGTEIGDAYFNLNNYRHVSGTGFNFKIGIIVKPINEIRIGLALHTPTWYNLSQDFDAAISSSYTTFPNEETVATDYAYFDWKLRTPLKFMAGIAGVIGTQGILSLDYQLDSYNNMNISERGTHFDYSDVNNDIKTYFKPQHTLRLGAEYRPFPELSLRAGYSYSTSAVDSKAANGQTEIFTSGTNPAYTFDKDTQSMSLGIGYRYQAFFADLAYVYQQQKSTYHAFTNYTTVRAPSFDLTRSDNNIVITAGFKF